MSHQQQQNGEDKSQDEQNMKVEAHILQYYSLLEVKGKGAYGIVWKAKDKKTNNIVALKKVFDAFHNSTDAQRTFREVMFLEQLKHHDNIIKLLKVIQAQNDKDLYMVFEYMETDLHKVIRANILEPLLKALKYQINFKNQIYLYRYLHSGELIHRDLKPANLLVDAECIVKLADFGLARTVNQIDDLENPALTEYVATRWYRAPEILLGSQKYSKAVDMWSIGCILGEMLINKAIFPGHSTMNQVELILDLLGKPTKEDIDSIQAPLAAHVLQNIQNDKKKSLKQVFTTATNEELDFIRHLLVFNPMKRLTVDEALKHPYMNQFSCTEDEPFLLHPIQTLMDDNKKFSTQEYRNALYRQINKTNKIFMIPTISPKKSPSPPITKTANILGISPKISKSPIQKGDGDIKKQQATNQNQKKNVFKSDIQDPSTTNSGTSTINSDKNKEQIKKQILEEKKEKEKLQKQLPPQKYDKSPTPTYLRGGETFIQSYKIISDMIKKQKEGLTQNTDSKKVLLNQLYDKSTQNSIVKDELKKSQSTKYVNNTSLGILKNSESLNHIKHSLERLKAQVQTPTMISQDHSCNTIKPRQSIGSQQRMPHQPFVGIIYQLAGRAQIYQKDQNQKQNRTAIDKPQSLGNTSVTHLKSNSFIQKKII